MRPFFSLPEIVSGRACRWRRDGDQYAFRPRPGRHHQLASVVALTSEAPGISIGYTASKAFMLAMSEGLGHELGYHVTLVLSATTAFSAEAMHAAHEIDGPTFAHAILTTAELVPMLAPPAARTR